MLRIEMFQFLCCSNAILAMLVSISKFDDFLQLAYHAGSFCVSVKIPFSKIVQSPRRRIGDPPLCKHRGIASMIWSNFPPCCTFLAAGPV